MKIETVRVFQSIAKQLDGCAGKSAGDEVRAYLREAVIADGGASEADAEGLAAAGGEGTPAGA
jgi:hypothetical protein